ncbi:hypothetical protein DRO64_06715 [Candidatus Bathyarchaeota archaeon]|nr:MAG: hypothetical protein DRO64_06715 [Candidatus Bathyarchaeota archaeon]
MEPFKKEPNSPSKTVFVIISPLLLSSSSAVISFPSNFFESQRYVESYVVKPDAVAILRISAQPTADIAIQ